MTLARTSRTLAAVFALSLLPALAAAQPGMFPVGPTPRDGVEESPSYSGRIVLADLAALGLVLGAGVTESGGIAWMGLATYLCAPAVVHMREARPGAALASLGLRALMPVAGATVGYHIEVSDGCHSEFCGLGGVLMGGLVGGATAVVIDQFFLARPSRAEVATRRWAPTAAMSSQGGSVGLIGTW